VQGIPDAVVRDTITAVLRQGDYAALSRLARVLNWIAERVFELLQWLFRTGRASGQFSWPLTIAVLILAVAFAARLLLGWRWRRADAAAADVDELRSSLRGQDPWQAAEAFAAGGDFTSAAHALYLALLEAGARRGELHIHPSKTVGDYARELRARSSAMLTRFRDFGRSYELVVYGQGQCDRQRYEGLLALATPVVRADG